MAAHPSTTDDAERMARRYDPQTSFDAAYNFLAAGKRDTQHKMILRYLLRGHDGSTACEIESALGRGGFRVRADKRMPELERAGVIKRGKARTCTITLERALTWWLVP